jgi:hypothetical protein
MTNVLVVGGGPCVDDIRASQQARGWDDQQAHWLSIQAMRRTAQLVHRRLVAQGHSVKIVESMAQLHERSLTLSIFLMEKILRNVDGQREDRLPEDWTVTSDSIAARLAVLLGAAECVLLKSALPAAGASFAALAATGFVDSHFPLVAGTLPIRVVNARGIEWPDALLADQTWEQVQLSIQGIVQADSGHADGANAQQGLRR